uniref:Superoxide dismutase [Cu-Zn] n=1 Tax=Chrysomela lapponica TaxID=153811 RepID=A0A0S2A455_CHRLA|nr:putative copper/zinc superoxide dismutase [Chrysomela lapponica]ALN12441.1 putative copper/zinc superoxide dismutase [Chrysomela lapponica]
MHISFSSCKMFRFAVLAAFLTIAYAERSAIVYLSDPSGQNGVHGNITFERRATNLQITGTIFGLSPGKHGFHVHQLGNIGPGCTGAGGHFNPHRSNHGAPSATERHVGDLGNIEADQSGVAHFQFQDSVIALQGDQGIIGRAMVVHEGVDDLGKGGQSDSLTTGHAGGRLACGVIGLLTE